MNAEDRKEYNKKYYEAHKEKIIKSACEKVFCDKCGRSVIKNNIKSHQKSKICARYASEKLAKPDDNIPDLELPNSSLNNIEINEQNYRMVLSRLKDFIDEKTQRVAHSAIVHP